MSPIYNYSCLECGKKIEKLVKTREEPPYCPDCGLPTVQVWSAPSPAQWKCSKGSL